MKTSKLIAVSAAALLATLGLQAQTAGSSSTSTTTSTTSGRGSSDSASTWTVPRLTVPNSSTSTTSASSETGASDATAASSDSAGVGIRASTSGTAAGSLSAGASVSAGAETPATERIDSVAVSTEEKAGVSAGLSVSSEALPSAPADMITSSTVSTTVEPVSTEVSVIGKTEIDTQTTTFIREIDAKGPVVIEKITTKYADIACSPENARKIVDALVNGTSVTLVGEDGKTASFRASGKLGYGEAYIALALAAEQLKAAGITSCATPEQWIAVFNGGPIGVTTSTTVVASSRAPASFPGILVLHSQGQGWGQIAQSSNVQLGQLVSTGRTTFELGAAGSMTTTSEISADSSKTEKVSDLDDKPSPTTSVSAESSSDKTMTKSGGAMEKPAANDAAKSGNESTSSPNRTPASTAPEVRY